MFAVKVLIIGNSYYVPIFRRKLNRFRAAHFDFCIQLLQANIKRRGVVWISGYRQMPVNVKIVVCVVRLFAPCVLPRKILVSICPA